MKDVAALVLPGTYLSSVGALVDGFALIARHVFTQFAPPYRHTMKTQVRLLSATAGGLEFAGGRKMDSDGDLLGDAEYSIVYVPAFAVASEEALVTLLEHAQPVTEWLRWQRSRGAVLAASGTGVLLLAQAGLLDGGPAAVPRVLRGLLRSRYPKVRVDTGATIAEHAGAHTCSVPASEWQLVARLVDRAISSHTAQWLASTTGTDGEREEGRLSSDDPLVSSAQFWLAQRFAQDFRISELADVLAVSHATLLRRFTRSLGMTPRAYASSLRIEAAKRMLRNTQVSIEQIAVMVGYSDVRAFRNIFHKNVAMSPSAYRRRGAGHE
ncbi:GlxA family transcriptional regulator [Paraburkholderia sp. BR10882]|uniref:GlxA family transcriptional regulator n=1 Tax=unclassified Paraburkholderia TaxID=2615204 RepID=UPI0034CDDBC8